MLIMKPATSILTLGLFFATGCPLLAAPAPHMAETSFEQIAQPLPFPYDEHADGHKQVKAALRRAKAAHKLLLIDLGGNWCPDCRILAGTMRQPDLAPFVAQHYETVMVDVGRYTKNMDIPVSYGAERPAGVPALLIIDPRTGKLLNAGHVTALSDARHMSPQGLADWLAQWTH